MAAATANCVSTSCYSVRESSHGRAASWSRTAFCGKKLAASLKAQAWLPAAAAAPTLRRSGRLQVSAVLADLDQTLNVSIPRSP
jgi:glucose-1-phosphate adenylyltransferase